MAVAEVDGVQVAVCSSNTLRPQAKTDWMEKLLKDNPGHLEMYTGYCSVNQRGFRDIVMNLMQQPGGTFTFSGKVSFILVRF